MARLSDSIIYGNLAITGEVSGVDIQQESQTVSVTTGQTTINLTTITVSSASLPTITVDGYYGVELIRNFTVTNSTTITLGSPIQANGQLTVTNYVAS